MFIQPGHGPGYVGLPDAGRAGTRLDNQDSHAKWRQFDAQYITESLKGKFAGGVRANQR